MMLQQNQELRRPQLPILSLKSLPLYSDNRLIVVEPEAKIGRSLCKPRNHFQHVGDQFRLKNGRTVGASARSRAPEVPMLRCEPTLHMQKLVRAATNVHRVTLGQSGLELHLDRVRLRSGSGHAADYASRPKSAKERYRLDDDPSAQMAGIVN
jgi:hypothetical protein